METPVELVKGRRGQFEISVDGHTVIARKGGLIAKLVGRPWPTEDDVITAVQDALIDVSTAPTVEPKTPQRPNRASG